MTTETIERRQEAAVIHEELDALVAATGKQRRHIVPLLHAIQDRYNYLPAEALRYVAATTDMPLDALSGVASFYTGFRMQPAGKHAVKVCIGTACHVKGAQTIFDAFKRELGIGADHDTDDDGLFTVEEVACLGCCMLAPAVQIDDIIYGHVEPRGVSDVLTDFLAAQALMTPSETVTGEGGPPEVEIRVCLCSSCLAGGMDKVHAAFVEQIRELGLPVRIKTVGCTGVSYQTPLVDIALADGRSFQYGRVTPGHVAGILNRHLVPASATGRLRARVGTLLNHLLSDGAREPVTRYELDVRDGPDAAYFDHQEHVVMEHCGFLDPLDLEDYIAREGFDAARFVLASLDAETVITEIAQSGLRGRGGAGYPTAAKWVHVNEAPGARKYIVCNGDEGDPGAFMDRMVMESFPYRVIEGMVIAAHAVGAREGFVYIRHEYPLAAHRMREAITRCQQAGLLGLPDGGNHGPLGLQVIEGAGAFVCGEETALLSAIEGHRGEPHYRPPYPAQKGLWGYPTLVNNVETFASVPWIIRNGADAFSELGSSSSKGTKTFALAGKINRGGLIEVPMGVTIREIVEHIGGGIKDGHAFKAVLIGGPSGGCVPASLADTPIDYEQLNATGAIMGSGGLVVLDETDCVVDIARYFLTFTQLESCGKCTFCRVGTRRLLEILERLCAGEGRKGDIERLEHLSERVTQGSLCGLGKTAPNPVLSSIRHFREEYEAHLKGECPALKCSKLVRYFITSDCIGCTRCAQHCPVDAIPMTPHERHEIRDVDCTRCDTCRQVCPSDAVKVKSCQKPSESR